MYKPRKLLAVILAMLLIFSLTVTAAADEQDDAADYVRQIVNYYRYYQDEAATDIDCLIYELSEIDLDQARAWASITEYWSYANEDMILYPGILPDGLPKDDSLCIVVLGYELADDGSMKKELIGRLETALASAEKYPNAYIACTGGGTARNNKQATEADAMAQWLVEKGIDAQRIIIENKSHSTVQNAKYTYRILSEKYPHVTHLALVSSDYHLSRASLLFHTQATLAAMEDSTPLLSVAANAAYETGRIGKESFDSQVSDLLNLSNVDISGMEKPELSKLDCILVSGNSQSFSGMELDLKVIAYYDTGLYRDVTGRAKYAGIDLASVGLQEVTVTYQENGITASSTVEIELLPPETEPPTQPPTEAPTEPATEPPTEPAATEPAEKFSIADFYEDNWLATPITIIIGLVIAEILVVIKLVNVKKREKAEREAAEEEKLPDDDSPLEYV